VVVHEAGEVLRSGGGSLYISRDGLWALDQLGYGEAFRQRSFAPRGFETWINGRLHRAHENDGVFRTVLRAHIASTTCRSGAECGVEIHTGVRVVGVEPSGTLILADASRRSADLASTDADRCRTVAPSFLVLAPLLKRAPLEARVDRYSTIRLPAWVRGHAVLVGGRRPRDALESCARAAEEVEI
jgi:2-polyprenyl-6-methoxyphenol hydroxylase-like FAD-dependent oxidoreductase